MAEAGHDPLARVVGYIGRVGPIQSPGHDQQRARRVAGQVVGHAGVEHPAEWSVAARADHQQVEVVPEPSQLLPGATVDGT